MKNLTTDYLSNCFLFVTTKRWLSIGLVALLALGMLQFVSAALTSNFELVSVNNLGTDSGNGSSSGQFNKTMVSADGRFVAFCSRANDLVTTDTNGVEDVFVRDRKTGTTSLVSVNKQGTDSGNGSSSHYFTISADGRFVVFESYADDLVATDTNGGLDIFVRDLQSETTTLVSVNKDGTDSGNSWSSFPLISANGQFVVFSSNADDLVTMDTNGIRDLFVRDLRNGITTQHVVSNEYSAYRINYGFPYMMSADGRFVAYNSDAINGEVVFAWDTQSGTSALVNVNKEGTGPGNGRSYPSAISADGRFLAFSSDNNDLVATDNNGVTDAFVRDLQNGTTILVSVNKDGTDSGNAASHPFGISDNGRFVGFVSDADDLVAMDTNGEADVFVRDLQSETTTLVSVNKDDTDSGNGRSNESVISADGRFVVFHSRANDLVSMDSGHGYHSDVFVRDLQSRNTIKVITSENNAPQLGAISADNRCIFFSSQASNLVATDTNDANDIFVFEMPVTLTPQGCNCDATGAIKGTSGIDFLYGTEQADIICGLEDKDFIAGMGGDDCIDGGDGGDWIDGGRGDDMIFGGAGKDFIYGDRGNDKISGDDDEDFLFGGFGDDALDGGEGYDWLFCGHGIDGGIGEYVRNCEH